MRVIILDVSPPDAALFESVLKSLVAESTPLILPPIAEVAADEPLAIAEPAPSPQPLPFRFSGKDKQGRKPAKVKHPAKAREEDTSAPPRVTIQSRLIGFLESGAKSMSEVRLLARRAGMAESIDVNQHLYNAKKAGKIAQDAEDRYFICRA